MCVVKLFIYKRSYLVAYIKTQHLISTTEIKQKNSLTITPKEENIIYYAFLLEGAKKWALIEEEEEKKKEPS